MRTYKTHRTIQDPKSGDYKSLCGILSDLADKPLTRKNDKVNCKRCIRKMDNMREHGKQFQPERTVQQDMFDEALPPEAKPLPRTNDNVEWVEFVDSNVIYEFNGLDGWAVQPVKPTGKLRRSGEMSGQVMLAGQGCYRTASSEAITEYIALNNPGTSVRFDLELYLAKHRSIARDCGEQSWVAQPTQAEIAKAEIAKTMYDSRNQDAEAKEFIERKILGLCKSDLDYWNDAFDKLSEEKITTEYDKGFDTPHPHYFKKISGATADDYLDIYAVTNMFEQKDAVLQHIAKKALCTGDRGHKNFMKDLEDIRDSAIRRIAMELAYQEGR
tara:strand:+ start:2772 stop:3755 length:984 start_codon:yes stop_codon:yes gene_type:complete